MNIDLEGNELKALKGLDLSIFRPSIICIELKNKSVMDVINDDISKHLNYFNYKIIAKTPLDTIFINYNDSCFSWVPSSIIT